MDDRAAYMHVWFDGSPEHTAELLHATGRARVWVHRPHALATVHADWLAQLHDIGGSLGHFCSTRRVHVPHDECGGDRSACVSYFDTKAGAREWLCEWIATHVHEDKREDFLQMRWPEDDELLQTAEEYGIYCDAAMEAGCSSEAEDDGGFTSISLSPLKGK